MSDGKSKAKKDSRLGNAQVPKSAMDQADDLAKKLDFSSKYVYSAAVQAFSQLDTKTQIAFVREAHERYAESAGGGNGSGNGGTVEPAPVQSIPAAAGVTA